MSLINRKVTFHWNSQTREGVVLDKYIGIKKLIDQSNKQLGVAIVNFMTIDFYMIESEGEFINVECKALRLISIK